jgi:hypothetical protein
VQHPLRLLLRALAIFGMRFGIYRLLPGEDLKVVMARVLCSDALKYEPTPNSVLPCILPYVGFDDVLIDLGCGKGDLLCYVASRRKFRKAIGVEIVPDLVKMARRNIVNFKLLTPIEIIETDIAEAELSEGTVFYLFNPFGENTLRKVLSNILISLTTHPRRIRILYYNPLWGFLLDSSPWLRPDGEIKTAYSFDGIKKEMLLRIWRNYG